jgi:hypothetical protein
MGARTSSASLPARLWTYQTERFPLVKHGLLIAVLAGSSVSVSAWLRQATPELGAITVAVLVLLGFFIQLRVADEHKDAEDDSRFRPERPVPRGLVTLAELRGVAISAGTLQLLATLVWRPPLVPYLLAVWVWMGLMSVEFFAPRWLKARPLIYLVSHMFIMPLLVLYALAADFLPLGRSDDYGTLGAFLGLAFCNGAALEIARKTWAPEQERDGVETYSKLLGVGGAAWATAAALTAALALLLVVRLQSGLDLHIVDVVPIFAFALAAFACATYARRPRLSASKAMESAAGLWVLTSYVALGVAPAFNSAAA